MENALLMSAVFAALLIGAFFAWMIMRGKIAIAQAQGRAEAETQLAVGQERVRMLEAECQQAQAIHVRLEQQVEQWRAQLDQERDEVAKLNERAERVRVLESELGAALAQDKVQQQELLRLEQF